MILDQEEQFAKPSPSMSEALAAQKNKPSPKSTKAPFAPHSKEPTPVKGACNHYGDEGHYWHNYPIDHRNALKLWLPPPLQFLQQPLSSSAMFLPSLLLSTVLRVVSGLLIVGPPIT